MTDTSWGHDLFAQLMKSVNSLAHQERSSKVVTTDQMQSKRKVEKKNDKKKKQNVKNHVDPNEGGGADVDEENGETLTDLAEIIASTNNGQEAVDPALVGFYQANPGMASLDALFGVEVLPRPGVKSKSLDCSRGEILALAALSQEGGQDVLLSLMVLRSFLIYAPPESANNKRPVTIPRFLAFQKDHQDKAVKEAQRIAASKKRADKEQQQKTEPKEVPIASPLFLKECLNFLAQHHVLSLTPDQLRQAAIFCGPKGLGALDDEAQEPYIQEMVRMLEDTATAVGSQALLFEQLHLGCEKSGTQQQWLSYSKAHTLFKLAGENEEDAMAYRLFKFCEKKHSTEVSKTCSDVYVLAAGFDYLDLIQEDVLDWEQKELETKATKQADANRATDAELCADPEDLLQKVADKLYVPNGTSRVMNCGGAAARVGGNRSMKTFYAIAAYLRRFNAKFSNSTINWAGDSALRVGDKDTLLWLRDNHKLGLRGLESLAGSRLRIDLLRWILEELNNGPITAQSAIKLDFGAVQSFGNSLHPNAYFTGQHRLAEFATMVEGNMLRDSLIPKQAAITGDVEALQAFDKFAEEFSDVGAGGQMELTFFDHMRFTVWPIALEVGARKGIIEIFEAYWACQMRRKDNFGSSGRVYLAKHACRLPQATTKKSRSKKSHRFAHGGHMLDGSNLTSAPPTRPDHRPTENKDLTIPQIAAIHGHRAVLDWIIKHDGIKPILKEDQNFALAADLLLEAAAHFGTVEDFQFLAGLGYTAWGRRLGVQKITYAHVAASQGHGDVLQFLTLHGNISLEGKKAIADRSGQIPMDFVSDPAILAPGQYKSGGGGENGDDAEVIPVAREEKTVNIDDDEEKGGKQAKIPPTAGGGGGKKGKKGKANPKNDPGEKQVTSKLNDLLDAGALLGLSSKGKADGGDAEEDSDDSDGIVVTMQQKKGKKKKR